MKRATFILLCVIILSVLVIAQTGVNDGRDDVGDDPRNSPQGNLTRNPDGDIEYRNPTLGINYDITLERLDTRQRQTEWTVERDSRGGWKFSLEKSLGFNGRVPLRMTVAPSEPWDRGDPGEEVFRHIINQQGIRWVTSFYVTDMCGEQIIDPTSREPRIFYPNCTTYLNRNGDLIIDFFWEDNHRIDPGVVVEGSQIFLGKFENASRTYENLMFPSLKDDSIVMWITMGINETLPGNGGLNDPQAIGSTGTPLWGSADAGGWTLGDSDIVDYGDYDNDLSEWGDVTESLTIHYQQSNFILRIGNTFRPMMEYLAGNAGFRFGFTTGSPANRRHKFIWYNKSGDLFEVVDTSVYAAHNNITVTYNGTTAMMYRNGVNVANTTQNGIGMLKPGGTTNFLLRGYSNNFGTQHTRFTQIKLWDRALNSSEVSELNDGTFEFFDGRQAVYTSIPINISDQSSSLTNNSINITTIWKDSLRNPTPPNVTQRATGSSNQNYLNRSNSIIQHHFGEIWGNNDSVFGNDCTINNTFDSNGYYYDSYVGNGSNTNSLCDKVSALDVSQFDCSNRTYSMWVKPDSANNVQGLFAIPYEGVPQLSFNIGLGDKLVVGASDTDALDADPSSILEVSYDTWNFFTVVMEYGCIDPTFTFLERNNTGKFYINGRFAGNFSKTFSSTLNKPYGIGRARFHISPGNDADTHLNGSIDEILVLSTSLNQTDKDQGILEAQDLMVSTPFRANLFVKEWINMTNNQTGEHYILENDDFIQFQHRSVGNNPYYPNYVNGWEISSQDTPLQTSSIPFAFLNQTSDIVAWLGREGEIRLGGILKQNAGIGDIFHAFINGTFYTKGDVEVQCNISPSGSNPLVIHDSFNIPSIWFNESFACVRDNIQMQNGSI